MNPSIEAKAQQWLAQDMMLALSNMVTEPRTGVYSVFDRWQIERHEHAVNVMRHGEKLHRFFTLRSALSWCTAQKYGQEQLALEITRLDRDLERLHATNQVQRSIVKGITNQERRSIVLVKQQETHLKLETALRRMQRCVSRAKYLQQRGFNDEIARTRRPAPYKPSRPGAAKSHRSDH